MSLNWTDSEDIALALLENHPEVNPLRVRFTDLRRWVTELDEFQDDPRASNEKKLEAIQIAWYRESKDEQD